MYRPAFRHDVLHTFGPSGSPASLILPTRLFRSSTRPILSLKNDTSSPQAGLNTARELQDKHHVVRTRTVGWRLSDKVRHFMRAVPHALTVISSVPREEGSQPKGLLISSFNSVAVSPIPYVSFNIKVPSSTFDAIQSSKNFMASIVDDRATAHAFAKMATDENNQWQTMLEPDGKLKNGHGGMVWMSCKWIEGKKLEVADHAIVVGEVLEAGKYEDRDLAESALVHWQGQYTKVTRERGPARQDTSVVRYVPLPEDAERLVRYTEHDWNSTAEQGLWEMRVEVVPYDPAWPKDFAGIKATLETALETVHILAIEHVGSTSVPGLPAKPIIDIDVIVTRDNLSAVISVLTSPAAGYEYKGELGIPDRHAFRALHPKPPRNLYVCVEGCLALRNHLGVRHVLKVDEDMRRCYGNVKMELAGREWPDDERGTEGYTRGKSKVLGLVLEKAGFGDEERMEIEKAQ
ncbi:MAG: hypothetical protein Q9163_001400 [Psora crenata]